jgi:ribosomal protection tetracycline resistance protein
LYGEVQKEVIASLLETEYNLQVEFAETRPIHTERPSGIGSAIRVMGAPGNRFPATVGLRVEPATEGTGTDYRLEVELGGLPRAFHTAIEETVRLYLQQGLYGWEVTDCRVALTATGYSSPVTVAGDFRQLVPLVLMEALARAGTRVYEPVVQFDLELPADAVSGVLAKLAEAGATIHDTGLSGTRLTGLMPAARVHGFETQLPGLSHGEGVLLASFGGFRPVAGVPPYRERTDGNPLNEKEYLTHLHNQ